MDNFKTGALIRELRKEKGLTQRELAERLHVTDRAVSKWERGLCAPDVSTLTPLAEALGCSVLALIAGEREPQAEDCEEQEEKARSVIEYSVKEIAQKIRRVKKTYLYLSAACLGLLVVICGWIFWQGGYFFVIDKSVSPDETKTITVYRKALDGSRFSMRDAVSLIAEFGGERQIRVTYGNCRYGGIWWAPDSKKYVIALEYDDRIHLALAWLERSAESNLSAYLSMGVQTTELMKRGYKSENGWPDIEYQFLQWGLDSASMLIYYAFEDTAGERHDGYFWYNCQEGTVSAVLELDA